MNAPSRQTYLVECFVPGSDREAVEAAGLRVTEAAADLRAEGRDVEYLRAILVPGDEVVFHVFAASDASAVHEASRRARVEFERVVESVAVDVPGTHGARRLSDAESDEGVVGRAGDSNSKGRGGRCSTD